MCQRRQDVKVTKGGGEGTRRAQRVSNQRKAGYSEPNPQVRGGNRENRETQWHTGNEELSRGGSVPMANRRRARGKQYGGG
ncbi:hypothetical protein SLA2020_366150 [Shorea laevis]